MFSQACVENSVQGVGWGGLGWGSGVPLLGRHPLPPARWPLSGMSKIEFEIDIAV